MWCTPQVAERLEELKHQHGEKLVEKESLKKRSDEMEVKLDRADKLVTGLAGERIRWEDRVAVRTSHPLHKVKVNHLDLVWPYSIVG